MEYVLMVPEKVFSKGNMMRQTVLKSLLFIVVNLSLLQLSHDVHAGSFMDKLIDPKDGKFDASDWLLKHSGFLPMPILITEPVIEHFED